MNFPYDMQFLRVLEGLRTPFFDAFFGAVTYLGHELLYMIAGIIVFWCISKKWGYYLLCVGGISTLISQFAKIACRIPRPWVKDPSFTIVENARAAATGYSFPSGHAAGIVGTAGVWARITEKKWLRWVCIALIVLVCFSRLYLGVHFPTDVLSAVVIGALLVFGLYPLFARGDDKPNTVFILVGIQTVMALLFVLYTELHAFPADTDPVNRAEAAKNAWSLLGSGFGMLLSLWLDHKYIHFEVKAVWWAQVLKVAVGLGILLGIKEGLKPVLNPIFGADALFTNAIRYFFVVAFAGGVWPLTFRWFARLGTKK
jgi:membrane-associated phospholipid phosphatase